MLKSLYEKDIALRELQQEHDKLRKTLQAELPKGPKAMTSDKPAERTSSPHDTSPSHPTLEQAPSLSMQNPFPIPVRSWQVNTGERVAPHGMDLPREIAPADLFPTMLAAFEHVQEIVERGYESASHDVGQPLSRSEINDVNRGSKFFRGIDEQKVVGLPGEESRHKRRTTREDLQTEMLRTYSSDWIGNRASPSIRPSSKDPYTRTRKNGRPNLGPSPPTMWQTPTPTPAHLPYPCRKGLEGSSIEASDIGTVSASEAFLKGYIKGQAKKQQAVRQRTLGYHRSLA